VPQKVMRGFFIVFMALIRSLRLVQGKLTCRLASAVGPRAGLNSLFTEDYNVFSFFFFLDAKELPKEPGEAAS
jgi:hypothetical protein